MYILSVVTLALHYIDCMRLIGSTFLKLVLPIIILTFLFEEVVSYVELKVSKMYVLRLLSPGATGIYTLSNNFASYQKV